MSDHRPTAAAIKAALDREVGRLMARGGEFGPGTWHVDLDAMSQDQAQGYVARLVEDRLLPNDPPLVIRPYVDRSVVARCAQRDDASSSATRIGCERAIVAYLFASLDPSTGTGEVVPE